MQKQKKKTYRKFCLDIMGEKWEVKYTHPVVSPSTGDPACGLCDWPQKTIWIDSELSHEMIVHTLLHELFHAYVRRSGIYNGNLSHELEEILADQFGLIIAENFDFNL